MAIRFCRDCANFEDWSDIDDTTLCTKNMEPCVCCEEFEPKCTSKTAKRLYDSFCVECTNFEDVNGILLCAKNHTPRFACDRFNSRFEKTSVTRLNNHMKTALVAHALNGGSKTDSVPKFVVEIARKID